jgi:methylthioribose-1-phosphate isomerase
MGIETVRWVGGVDGFIELIDQRQLPVEFKILRCYKVEELFDAVQTLAVRGAPAIGVAAGYGVVLGLNEKVETNSVSDGIGCVNKVCEYLKTARPTAVNLFYALDRMKKAAERFQRENEDNLLASLSETLLSEANAIYDEDVQMCRRIGENGEKLRIIPQYLRIVMRVLLRQRGREPRFRLSTRRKKTVKKSTFMLMRVALCFRV